MISFNSYNPVKSMKRMIRRPNMMVLTFLVTVILSIMMTSGDAIYYLTPVEPSGTGTAMDHDYYVPRNPPDIYIKKNGTVRFDGRTVKDLKKFSISVKDHNVVCREPENKIHLRVEKTTPFGAVQKVLKAAQAGNVKKVTFITRPRATYADFWFPKNAKYRKLYL